MDNLIQCLDKSKTGVNGADIYTTLTPLLDIFSNLIRGTDKQIFQNRIKTIFDSFPSKENIVQLIVMAFYCRDILEGCGERDLFYYFFEIIFQYRPQLAKELLYLIPSYGAWFDLYMMFEKSLGKDSLLVNKAVDIYYQQLLIDSENPKTLAAKWAPREGKHSSWFGEKIADLFGNDNLEFDQKDAWRIYRKYISRLNKILRTTETLMCQDSHGNDHWEEIVPSRVPSLCLLRNKKAFLSENKEGTIKNSDKPGRLICRANFLKHFQNCRNGMGKLNGKVLMPHQFVKEFLTNPNLSKFEKEVLELQFENLVESIQNKGSLGRTIVMVDTSGSMHSGGTENVRPLDVSIGMGILISRCTHKSFRNRVLTFDQVPNWAILNGNLEEDIHHLCKIGQGLNTDILRAFEMLLVRMTEVRIKPGEEPDNIIIITDMGWDKVNGEGRHRHLSKSTNWETHLQIIQKCWKRSGENLFPGSGGWTPPRVIVWNVSHQYKEYHHLPNTPGVFNISGWSPSILKYLMNGDDIVSKLQNPIFNMESILSNDRYDVIREVCQKNL